MKGSRLGAGLVAVAWWAVLASGTEGEPQRDSMAAIFEAVRTLLPLSLSDEKFRDPARREEIRAQLATLAHGSKRLESHAADRDAGFAFLSRSLARDTRDILERYDEGRVSEARFLLHQLTDDCVACHSRLPSDEDSPLSERFVAGDTMSALPLDQRAKLEMATRQFDRALASHEALFASRSVSPQTLDLSGHFDDYLEATIRVRRDPSRARRALEAFARRDDLSSSLRANVAAWISALRELEAVDCDGDGLARARELVRTARDTSRYPDDRAALVPYTAASSLLYRYVTEHSAGHPGFPEAYYLLGVVEARVGRAFWLSQTEFFLETCIRLEPRGPFAQRAFDLLEEFVVSGYTGSAGQQVPAEVRHRLEELWRLMRSDTAAESGA